MGSFDYWGIGVVLTDPEFTVKTGMGPIRCLVISRKFTSDGELGKVSR